MWKEFFEENFEGVNVSVCTVVVDNEDLVALLVKRQTYYSKILKSLPREVEVKVGSLNDVLIFAPEGSQGVVDKIKKLDEEIDIKGKENFDVSSVFITFEKQANKNIVLEQMKRAKLKKEPLRFNGKILTISEPAEPSSIRWGDLDESRLVRFTTFKHFDNFISSYPLVNHLCNEGKIFADNGDISLLYCTSFRCSSLHFLCKKS